MIGDTLRRERERQNLTIKDIEKGTSIRSLYIEAIENGDYKTLPGEVYTKGFIRNYATFLKLDPNACLEQYLADTHASEILAAEAEVVREKASVAARPQRPANVERAAKGGGGGLALVAAALVLVLGGAYFVLDSAGDKSSDKRHARAMSSVSQELDKSSASREVSKPDFGQAAKAESHTALPATETAGNANVARAAATSGVEVVANFSDKCWTRVVADGQIVFEGTLDPGHSMTWKGRENISITMGNAGAVELIHNGKNLGKAGGVGQVVDRMFTRTSVN